MKQYITLRSMWNVQIKFLCCFIILLWYVYTEKL